MDPTQPWGITIYFWGFLNMGDPTQPVSQLRDKTLQAACVATKILDFWMTNKSSQPRGEDFHRHSQSQSGKSSQGCQIESTIGATIGASVVTRCFNNQSHMSAFVLATVTVPGRYFVLRQSSGVSHRYRSDHRCTAPVPLWTFL